MGAVVVVIVVALVIAFFVWNRKATRENSKWTQEDQRMWNFLNGKSYSDRSAQEEAYLKVLQSKKEVRRLQGLE